MDDMKIQKLADFILNSKYTVVLTGAGCSVDSGVPDFRSPQGWWKKIDPRTVATVEALKTNYDMFRSFYQARIQHLDGITPHEGHQVLSRWGKVGKLQMLATQNVDGLHQASGNRHVKELHGSIRSFRCHDCQRHASKEQFMSGESCSECGGMLRPNVVLFGESLSEEEWARTLEAVRKAELVIVIGTSLQVYPANQLPRMTSGRTVLINMEATGEEDKFDLFIAGRTVEVLPAVEEAIKGTVKPKTMKKGGTHLSFQERAKRHLTLYKENSLGILESGLWKKNKRTYTHILPEEMKDLNLLSLYRKELFDYIRSEKIRLHQDFHHLNSSQVACLNFFFPMLKENRINLLLELLELTQEEALMADFEKIVSRSEGTNFDFYIELNTGRKLFFEIKYTEVGFGKVSDHPKYRKKYEEIYQCALEGKIRQDVDAYSALTSNYQLLRNISYVDANRNDLLIVICPDKNEKLRNEFDIVMNEIVDPHLHNKIRFLTWEWMLSEILKKLELTKSYDRFLEHYTQFADKYIFD